jgi:multidrug efflux pump
MTRYEERLAKVTDALKARYQSLLTQVLARQRFMVWLFVIFLALTGLMYKALPTELLPVNELNFILGAATGPSSANNTFMQQQSEALVQELRKKFPQIKNDLIGNSDVGSVFFMLELHPSGLFGPSFDTITREINNIILRQYPNINGGLSVFNANQTGGNNHQGNFYFYVTGLASYQEISSTAQRLADELKAYPGVTSPVNVTQFNNQVINLTVNRDFATSLNVNINDINVAISTLFGGYTAVTQYQVGGYGYPIVVQLPEADLQNFSILNTTYVKNANNQLIPLSSLVSAKMALDLPYRMHVNLLRAGEVDANIAPGYTTGQVMAEVYQLAKNLPANLSVTFADRIANFQQNINAMDSIFVLGFIFIYLVLAALFESFIDPLIMLVGIPPCILGALFALWLMGGSLNIYTSISLVTLIGLVSKHGVLITQFSNQLRAEGMELTDAVKRAASIRLRPILMTSLTMILGALPLIFATGTDAFGRRQIGLVIVFGLILGTFFSLFVVPVAYTILAQFKHKFKH